MRQFNCLRCRFLARLTLGFGNGTRVLGSNPVLPRVPEQDDGNSWHCFRCLRFFDNGPATAGQEFSLISMLVSTIARATPIALGALSGILCERSGVVNIGIEGMLLGGAFTGVVMGSLLGGWVGLLAATLTGVSLPYCWLCSR